MELCSCYVAAWMRGEFRGEWTRAYVWLSPFAVRVKLFPSGASGKEPACQCRTRMRHGFDLWVRKIPWRRKWQPTPVIFALGVPKSGTQLRIHARTRTHPGVVGGTVHLSFRSAGRFTLHSPAPLSLSPRDRQAGLSLFPSSGCPSGKCTGEEES